MHLLTTQLEDLKSKLQNELDQQVHYPLFSLFYPHPLDLQRNVWTFLANKYKKLTSHAMKNGSVDSFTDPDDKILVQLISLVLQKHPDRFVSRPPLPLLYQPTDFHQHKGSIARRPLIMAKEE
jgi:hypothetical protein